MLDREGYRPNVGIILLNGRNQVFWGKRLRTHSWQFPQGGIKHGESPEQAMFRELHEEVGLLPEHVRIVARTRDWLRYEVPDHFIRRDARGHYKGQKQIWFLLQLTGRDSDMNLRATDHPEFDAWRWNDYWVPLEMVIEFKRGVYQMALSELARFLPRTHNANRFLRSGLRGSMRRDASTGLGPDGQHASGIHRGAGASWPASGREGHGGRDDGASPRMSSHGAQGLGADTQPAPLDAAAHHRAPPMPADSDFGGLDGYSAPAPSPGEAFGTGSPGASPAPRK